MTTAEILERLRGLSALVIGDICLDRWCQYDPAAADISRETGLARVAVVSSECTPGAGGTVANNLAALGIGSVAVAGVIGTDGHAYELEHALASRGISAGYLVKTRDIQTFTYTKLLNVQTGEEDLPRVDFITTKPLETEIERELLGNLEPAVQKADVILISDQAETGTGGVVTPALRDELARLAALYPSKIFWVDSRLRLEHFRRMIVKPNEQEALSACRRAFGEVDYSRLRYHLETPLLLVTHGSSGVLLIEDGRQTWVRTTRVQDPVDICGAGDSFSAGAACALAVTSSPAAAARFGNLVASITIMKKGTGTASPQEVLEAGRRSPL